MSGRLDWHRKHSEACRIEWRGKVLTYSEPFATQLMLAHLLMRPDGPFPAFHETVDLVAGTEIVTLDRDGVDELLELTLSASVAVNTVLNQAKAAAKKGA